MRIYLSLFLLLLLTVGCGVQLRPNAPTPTIMVLPPTWTPSPTHTPAPPTATATLVVQDTPVVTGTVAANFRRYPDAVNGTIGRWADTTNLTPTLLSAVAAHVQLISGPQALAARQANPRVFTLGRLDTSKTAQLASDAQALARSDDGLWVDTRSVQTFSAADSLLATLHTPVGTHLLIASTYAWDDGAAYAQHSAEVPKLLARVDGVCMCDFVRTSGGALDKFKAEADWKQDVDALAALVHTPNALVLVATRFDKVSDDTAAQLAPWFDYALASYLLGADGNRTYFSFQGPHADEYMASGELNTTLGYSFGAYYPIYGMYARNFQKGLVLVNPGNEAREMPLSRTYSDSEGQQLTRALLPPHTGMILLLAQ